MERYQTNAYRYNLSFPKWGEQGLQTEFNLQDKEDCQKLIEILEKSNYRFINKDNKLPRSIPVFKSCSCKSKTMKCNCYASFMVRLLSWYESRAKIELGIKKFRL